MRNNLLFILLACLFFTCRTTPPSGTTTPIQSFKITPTQQQLLFDQIKNYPTNTQLSIAIISGGEADYFGALKQKDTTLRVDNHRNIFEIGSITKVFTSTLLANYIVEGKINPQEPVNPYLPIKIKDDIQLTFEDLANHTAGLPRIPSNMSLGNFANPYQDYSVEKLERYLSEFLSVTTTPKTSQYSNLGTGILSYSLQQLENKSFEQLLQEKIFSKYGMKNSTTKIKQIRLPLVKGLDYEGKPAPNWDFNAMEGIGAILSNVEDLAQFALAQMDSTNLELALTQQKTFTVNEQMDMGLGWHLLKTPTGKAIYWHNGGTGGYTSSMAINPTNQSAVIILSNISSYHQDAREVDGLCFSLLRTLAKK